MRSLRYGLAVMALVTLVSGPTAARAQFFFDENPLIGKQAPDFTLKTLQGDEVSLTQLREGQPAIIYFWATWCPHCRTEFKMLGKQAEELKKKGIKILLVNLEESPRQIHPFVEKFKVPFPVLLDEKSEVSEEYSIIGVPTLFFINKDGVVLAMEHQLPKGYEQMLLSPAAEQ